MKTFKSADLHDLPDGKYEIGDYTITVETLDLDKVEDGARYFQVRAVDANYATDAEIDILHVLTTIVEAKDEYEAIADFMTEGDYSHDDTMIIDVQEVYEANYEMTDYPTIDTHGAQLIGVFHMDELGFLLPVE